MLIFGQRQFLGEIGFSNIFQSYLPQIQNQMQAQLSDIVPNCELCIW